MQGSQSSSRFLMPLGRFLAHRLIEPSHSVSHLIFEIKNLFYKASSLPPALTTKRSILKALLGAHFCLIVFNHNRLPFTIDYPLPYLSNFVKPLLESHVECKNVGQQLSSWKKRIIKQNFLIIIFRQIFSKFRIGEKF